MDKKTVVSKKNPNELLGQRLTLSKVDIERVNKLYGCNALAVVGNSKGEEGGDSKSGVIKKGNYAQYSNVVFLNTVYMQSQNCLGKTTLKQILSQVNS